MKRSKRRTAFFYLETNSKCRCHVRASINGRMLGAYRHHDQVFSVWINLRHSRHLCVFPFYVSNGVIHDSNFISPNLQRLCERNLDPFEFVLQVLKNLSNGCRRLCFWNSARAIVSHFDRIIPTGSLVSNGALESECESLDFGHWIISSS